MAHSKIDKPPAYKFFFRVSWSAWKLLEEARKEAGFKSLYELGQSIIACYVRYLRKKKGLLPPEEENEFLDDEVEEMFADFSQAEKHFEWTKPKRKRPQYEVNNYQGQKDLFGYDGTPQT